MKTNKVIEILVEGGIGRVWKSREGQWSWAHPDGSEGIESSCEDAVGAVESIGRLTIDEQNDSIREQVNREMPKPAGGFESDEARAAWVEATEKRFMELVNGGSYVKLFWTGR